MMVLAVVAALGWGLALWYGAKWMDLRDEVERRNNQAWANARSPSVLDQSEVTRRWSDFSASRSPNFSHEGTPDEITALVFYRGQDRQ